MPLELGLIPAGFIEDPVTAGTFPETVFFYDAIGLFAILY